MRPPRAAVRQPTWKAANSGRQSMPLSSCSLRMKQPKACTNTGPQGPSLRSPAGQAGAHVKRSEQLIGCSAQGGSRRQGAGRAPPRDRLETHRGQMGTQTAAGLRLGIACVEALQGGPHEDMQAAPNRLTQAGAGQRLLDRHARIGVIGARILQRLTIEPELVELVADVVMVMNVALRLGKVGRDASASAHEQRAQ